VPGARVRVARPAGGRRGVHACVRPPPGAPQAGAAPAPAEARRAAGRVGGESRCCCVVAITGRGRAGQLKAKVCHYFAISTQIEFSRTTSQLRTARQLYKPTLNSKHGNSTAVKLWNAFTPAPLLNFYLKTKVSQRQCRWINR